jgi:transposase
MSELPVERLVFLDESGVRTRMARTHARAPRGQCAYGSIPLGSWQRLTVLDALACEGLVATMSIETSTSTSLLLAYLEQVLMPELRQMKPDAILVMDNLRPHPATEVRELLARAGIRLIYLPPYSPEFNPIEHAWAKIKERLAASKLWRRNSNPLSTPSPLRMPEAGSGMPVMPYTDPKNALASSLGMSRVTASAL